MAHRSDGMSLPLAIVFGVLGLFAVGACCFWYNKKVDEVVAGKMSGSGMDLTPDNMRVPPPPLACSFACRP